jgi:tRNA nucleotidyltransferase/poly(A) polymerase
LYLVGGAVRDLMTGSPIRDLDFTVEGNPLRLARRLQNDNMRRWETDSRFGGAELVMPDGVSLSLEMARSEAYEAPGKAPKVAPAPILEDLRRRDFSINAMGISLTPGSRGLLLDPTNGLADIEGRELRVLHNYSFVHDPVRLLRLVRFAARLGYRAEPRTQGLFEAALERRYQDYIQAGPLGREVQQIAAEANGVAVLKALANRDLLAVLHPMLPKRKPDYDSLVKLEKYRQQAEEAGYRMDPFLPVLHYLTKRLKTRARNQLLRNLGLKKATAKQMQGLEKEARKVVKLLGRRRKISPREIFRLLTPVPLDLLIFVLAECSHKRKIQAKIYNYLFKYRPLRKKLPVRELQLMGMQPGPKFDQVLEKYFDAQLDGKLRRRPEQLRFLRKLAGLPKAVPKAVPKPAPKARPPKERPKKAAPPVPPAGVSPAVAQEAQPADTPARPPAKPATEKAPKAAARRRKKTKKKAVRRAASRRKARLKKKRARKPKQKGKKEAGKKGRKRRRR